MDVFSISLKRSEQLARTRVFFAIDPSYPRSISDTRLAKVTYDAFSHTGARTHVSAAYRLDNAARKESSNVARAKEMHSS